MRTRTLITGAAFLLVGVVGARQASAQALAGSDTLEDVTENVIANCPLAVGISYIGGGSGAGQAAMSSGAQHVASMSRQLNNAQCTPESRQLLVGLDGLSIVVKNAAHLGPDSCSDESGGATGGPLVLTGIPAQFIPCSSATQCTSFGTTCDTVRQFCIPGGTLGSCTAAQGCSPDGTYTFNNNNTNAADDWQDVLRQIYGGMNHVTTVTALLVDPNAAVACTTDANCPVGRLCVSGQCATNTSQVADAMNADGQDVCQTFTIVADTATCSPTVACPAGQFCNNGACAHQVAAGGNRPCIRNPARLDCTNPVRGVLLASYSQFIRSPLCTPNQVNPPVACTDNAQCPANSVCNTTIGQCIAEGCVKIKHAFRRDDLSGTTDAFQAIVGLQAIAPFTTLRSTAGGNNAPEIADFGSLASPFCNAGTRAMNKGFSDGLDLDPYRRFCTAGAAPDRIAFESACEAWQNPTVTTGDAGCYIAGGSPTTYPQRERSAPQGRGFVAGGAVDTLASLINESVVDNTTRPRCLGVVLPISIPQDTGTATVWATHRYPQGGTCTQGARAFVNPLPARTIMCPDGQSKAIGGTCRMAQNTTNLRFDCITESPRLGGVVQDSRIFNMSPVNSVGNMATLVDSYANPSFPGVAQLKRFARRFYGLHMARPDSSQTPATIATGCTFETDTSQIGCLVKASPCSIGFAGREAADAVAPFNNLALRQQGVQPTIATIENLATGLTPVYPLARKLWFNSFQQGGLVGFETPNLTTGEQELSTCMGLPVKCVDNTPCAGLGGTCNTATGRCTKADTAKIDAAIAAFNFVVVPASVPRLVLNAMGQGCGL